MGKDKQKDVKPDAEVKTVKEIPQGVTVNMGVYKPIPRFRGGCPNC